MSMDMHVSKTGAVINEDDIIERLKGIKARGDIETGHRQANAILCDLLRKLGFDEVVDAYEAVEKWYA